MPTNAAMIAANAGRWSRAHIHAEWQKVIDATADRLTLPANKVRFQTVERNEGVKWFAVAIIKEREAGADPAFKLSIAQGDPWASPSRHVPAGRGPFVSWEGAAHDALVDCAPYAARWHDWSIGGLLTILEKYNGVGYAAKGLPSPYVWSATDQYVKGKYVRDGVFDPEFVDRQIGCAALLIAMQKRDPSIQFEQPGTPARPTAQPPAVIIDNATKKEKQVRAGSAAAGTAAGATKATTEAPSHPFVHSVATYSIIGIAVILFVATTIIIGRKVKAINDIW
jgi:lysozyme family protein